MARILDYNGEEADRTATVASLVELKGSGSQLVQVTATTAAESCAAEAAGIEMAVCMSDFVPAVREGSGRLFVTAAIDFTGAITPDELLGVAITALSNGADAIITARRLEVVELLAAEDIPVMGHLGFVPKKSTLYGGVRGVGKSAAEATELWNKFRRLEDAGAFAVECELIPHAVMSEINRRTAMTTISLGSGPAADVVFLFMSDICGESQRTPRHARRYVDLSALYGEIETQRVEALTAFRADVATGDYPSSKESIDIEAVELTGFVESFDQDVGSTSADQ